MTELVKNGDTLLRTLSGSEGYNFPPDDWTAVSMPSYYGLLTPASGAFSNLSPPPNVVQVFFFGLTASNYSYIKQSITFPSYGNYTFSVWWGINAGAAFSGVNANVYLGLPDNSEYDISQNYPYSDRVWKQYTININVSKNLTQELRIGGSTLTSDTQLHVTGISIIPAAQTIPCFLKGTLIHCMKKTSKTECYIPIEELYESAKEYFIKTFNDGYKSIKIVGKQEVMNEGGKSRLKNSLYQLNPINYPELFKPLVITGNHGIIVPTLDKEEEIQTKEQFGKIFITDGLYRLFACLDKRANLYQEKGMFNIYHVVLDSDDDLINYGIYANGLLVESCSLWSMMENSAMEQKIFTNDIE